MFKTLAIIPVITTVALAQTSSSPFIPSGCSDNCSSFLKSLNSDNSLSSCTSLVNSATSAFSPGGDGVKNPSQDKVTSALGKLCSGDNPCSSDLLGTKIANFYSACSAELTSKPIEEVVKLYDSLYALTPFRNAICSKDGSGNYCLEQSKLPPSTNANDLQAVLASTSSSNPAVLLPNDTTFRNNRIPYLFLNPSATSSELCNVCTRNIMNSFLEFEGSVPYGPGLSKSPLLSEQQDLYQDISKTCGNNFLAGVVKAAGGLSGGSLSSGASATVASAGANFAVAVLSVFVIAVSSFL